MFLVDDVLTSPFKGLLYVFREIQRAAEQDAGNQAESIRADLSDLYMLLESGQIAEEEADAREKALLDRLDAIEALDPDEDVDDVEEEDEDEDEEDDGDDDGDDDPEAGELIFMSDAGDGETEQASPK